MGTRYGSMIGVKGRCMKPTLKHRPAIWECMLGTVYAMNNERDIRYFDYKWEDAIKFAGIAKERDIRIYRVKERVSWGSPEYASEPSVGRMVVWITK